MGIVKLAGSDDGSGAGGRGGGLDGGGVGCWRSVGMVKLAGSDDGSGAGGSSNGVGWPIDIQVTAVKPGL